MTIHKKISSLLSDLLADNEIESAINYSRNYVKSLQENSKTTDLKLNELSRIITHLSQEFKQLCEEKIKGTVSREETDLHRKNITEKVLTFLEMLGSLDPNNVERKILIQFLEELSHITQTTSPKQSKKQLYHKYVKLLNVLMAIAIICLSLFIVKEYKSKEENNKLEAKNLTSIKSVEQLHDSITVHRNLGGINTYYIKTTLKAPKIDSINSLLQPALNSIYVQPALNSIHESIDSTSLASRIEETCLSFKSNESMVLEFGLAIDNTGEFTITSQALNGSAIDNSLEIPQSGKDYLCAVQEEIKRTEITPSYNREFQNFMSSDAILTVIIIST